MVSLRSPNTRTVSFLTVCVTGFAATIAQILIIRELLVLFYGNELSAGLIFAGWLLWNALGSWLAARRSARIKSQGDALGILLIWLAILLPVSILLVRASGLVWSIPGGALPDIEKMAGISFGVTGLVCPVSGALFATCWALFGKQLRGKSNRNIVIYLGEALGAGLGGLIFYFVFLQVSTTYRSMWLTSVLVLLTAGWATRVWRLFVRPSGIRLLWSGAALLLLAGALWGGRIDNRSYQWRWGPQLLEVRDTAFQQMAIVKKGRQVSVFGNGLWLFSAPDALIAELATHPAMLQHPDPKNVLLIGGGVAGQLAEILKYPGIKRIDYLEADPKLIPFVRTWLPEHIKASLDHPKVKRINEDAAVFLRRYPGRYDVILLNEGDPVNAQMNRFFTVEFFASVKQGLASGGIFSFAVSGGADMLGPLQAQFLVSFQQTLQRVFAKVTAFPGDHVRFLAGDASVDFITEADGILERIENHRLELDYVRRDRLDDMLNPFRMDYLASILKAFDRVAINRDYRPTCYFYNMMIWGFQWHPLLQRAYAAISRLRIGYLWLALLVAGALIVSCFWNGAASRLPLAVSLSVMAVGCVEIVVQMVLLLGFQIVAGFVYEQLALIIAFFMAGLAAGAGLVSIRSDRTGASVEAARSALIIMQLVLSLLPLVLLLMLLGYQKGLQSGPAFLPAGWGFTLFGFATGLLGGIHFSLAVLLLTVSGGTPERVGGKLYALDLFGSAGGVLIASLVILPIFGLIHTLFLLSAVSFVSLMTLLCKKKKSKKC